MCFTVRLAGYKSEFAASMQGATPIFNHWWLGSQVSIPGEFALIAGYPTVSTAINCHQLFSAFTANSCRSHKGKQKLRATHGTYLTRGSLAESASKEIT